MEIRHFPLVFLVANFAIAPGQDIHFPGEKIARKVPISEQKCEEYNKPIGDELRAISLVADDDEDEPITSNDSKCNFDGIPLVVGGTPAKPGEFPFMASVGWIDAFKDTIKWQCGGTLISEKFVLTAGHCRWDLSLGAAPKLVRLGEHAFSDSRDNAIDFGIHQIVKHPDHSFKSENNDIALLELNGTVTFTKWIRPACLWNRNVVEASSAIATGWGITDPGDKDSTSDELLKVELRIIPNSQCVASYARLGTEIVDSMLCAGDLKQRKDTCQGDSGGPLFLTREGGQCKFYVIGVTSFGQHCATKKPAVYTRVSSFIRWIEETVW